MPGCELCGAQGKTIRVSLTGFGIIIICGSCKARLAAAYPGQRPEIARQITAESKHAKK